MIKLKWLNDFIIVVFWRDCRDSIIFDKFKSKINIKSVADPGFPRVAPTTKVGVPTYYFGQFSPKTT